MAVRVDLAPKGGGRVHARANRLAGFVGAEGPAREVFAAIKSAVQEAAGRDRSKAKIALFLHVTSPGGAPDHEFFAELGQFVATRGMVMTVHHSDFPDASVDLLAREPPHAPPDTPGAAPIRIGLWPYLKTMALIAWSAFRHPRKTTVIDLATGDLLERY